MSDYIRPWRLGAVGTDGTFGPTDCLLSQVVGRTEDRSEHVVLMQATIRGSERKLLLHPYPARGSANAPTRSGLPIRPRRPDEPRTEAEQHASATLGRMNHVLARIQELEEALDDPEKIWPRLREAWSRAEDEADPRMAEIVRQAREIRPHLRDLERRVRRVLRRSREMVPLDRVQEMDRGAMLWLVRQPGRRMVERAGADQRIKATVRREDFDTLENRVLHAYVRLAADVSREWMREHAGASSTQRFLQVETYRKFCRAFAVTMADLGVGIAPAGVTPNYVLMQDRGYRCVREAWERLLQRERAIDELWAWQAESWTDFTVLAILLALDELEESEVVAQSPILWRSEALTGRWFAQDRPIAVFWLRETGRVVEVLSRPEPPGTLQFMSGAHVSLRVSDPARSAQQLRIAVWTPHSMNLIDPQTAARNAAGLLDQMRNITSNEVMRDGLILMPAHDRPVTAEAHGARGRVTAISLDAKGQSLASGIAALRNYVRSDIFRSET